MHANLTAKMHELAGTDQLTEFVMQGEGQTDEAQWLAAAIHESIIGQDADSYEEGEEELHCLKTGDGDEVVFYYDHLDQGKSSLFLMTSEVDEWKAIAVKYEAEF